jgi:hypothetical protein
MSVEEIEKAIKKLSARDRARIRVWLEEVDEKEWDRQIERDAKTGKLDKFAQKALEDVRAGRFRKL